MAKFFSRRSVAVAFSALALTLAGGGIAVAAQPTTVVQAPVDSGQPAARAGAASGQPQVTPEEARQARAALKGAVGTEAIIGSTSFAVVGVGGNLIRGNDAVSATRFGPGQYQVLFNRDLTRSAYVATIGTNFQCCIPPAGEIAVAPRLNTPNAVYIETYNSAGRPADRPFHLAVFS
ncbi:hypothetical protein Vqi01_34910 [Micromonospora qiuiae]|uniref:Secreted protein n=1 Tax=Micromonospora qiuiae TaxID=502268 RepID=A0ABQ4JDR5_9ACTN|nr:hypothetical protein [Micromonospora qiuiae]GIJ28329.1 hypothetical protein Vqi01_34910 [Micromonospora qiuiae]